MMASSYDLAGVGGICGGGGVGEGLGTAETNGVGVGYQYKLGSPVEPFERTVVEEPPHAASIAICANTAAISLHLLASHLD